MVDVAEAAGVSVATVSMVLSGKAGAIRIPEETQQRVAEVAAELRYQRNVLAAGLRRQTYDTIGLISDFIATTPHAGALLQGTQDALWEAGKALIIINTEGDADTELAAIDVMLGRQVDGLIHASMYHQIVAIPEAMRRVPLVLLDARSEDLSVSSVAPNEEGGSYTATAHLLDAGHRVIGYLQDEVPKPATEERLAGYRRALEERGLAFDPSLVVEAQPEHTGGAVAAQRLLDRPQRPTAIACFNDRMAAGATRAAYRAGLSIPEDLSLVGFDNEELVAPLIEPPLTTVQLPHYEMGHWAGERLLALISDPDLEPQQHRVTCELVVRESVAGPQTATTT